MPAGFLVGKLVQNEDTNRRATLFEAVTSAQVQRFNNYFFNKGTFWKKLIFQKSNIHVSPTFSGKVLVESGYIFKAYISVAAAFLTTNLFKR